MSVAESRRTVSVPVRPPRLLLLGNPNTGKTTLFNRLCGMRAKKALGALMNGRPHGT